MSNVVHAIALVVKYSFFFSSIGHILFGVFLGFFAVRKFQKYESPLFF